MWPDKMGAMVPRNLRPFSFFSVSLFFSLSPAFLSIQSSKCFRHEVIFMFSHGERTFYASERMFYVLERMFEDVEQHF